MCYGTCFYSQLLEDRDRWIAEKSRQVYQVSGQPEIHIVKLCLSQWWWKWWHMALLPALWRQRQTDLSEFEASLVYEVSSKIVRAVTQRNLSKIKKLKKKKKFKTFTSYSECSTATQKSQYCREKIAAEQKIVFISHSSNNYSLFLRSPFPSLFTSTNITARPPC